MDELLLKNRKAVAQYYRQKDYRTGTESKVYVRHNNIYVKTSISGEEISRKKITERDIKLARLLNDVAFAGRTGGKNIILLFEALKKFNSALIKNRVRRANEKHKAALLKIKKEKIRNKLTRKSQKRIKKLMR